MSERDFEQDLRTCEAATPGPWVTTYYDERVSKTPHWCVDCNPPDVLTVAILDGGYGGNEQLDADFIAAAREGWPAAIREVLRLKAENERLRLVLRDIGGVAGLAAIATLEQAND